MQEKNIRKWFRLDNAATIFPGQNTGTWSNIFRFSVQLKEPVQKEILEQALRNILPRFECFDVRIRKGLFWHYFEKNPHGAPDVLPDIQNPCHRVKFNENKGYLFRVYYHENRISIDTYHAITDGHGASIFTCTLAAEYLRLLGHSISCNQFVLDINKKMGEGEIEDSFKKNATSKGKVKRGGKFVYHSKGTRLPKHFVNITSGIMSFEELHKITKVMGVTITEYFAAILIDILIKRQQSEGKKQKEISIQVPVDLRRTFKSKTLRNFSLCLRVVIDPNLGEYSFEELLKQVRLQLHLANDPKVLNAMITANLGLEKNAFLRFMPLGIKNLGVYISFLITGEQTTSALLSNLGPVKLPDDMVPFVEKLMIMPGPGIRNGARSAVVTFEDTLVITFANCFKERDIEREFFTRLVKSGVKVKIEGN